MPSPYMGTLRLFQSTCEVSSNTYVSVSSYMCGSSDRTECCCTYRFSELHSSVWHLFSVFTIPIPLFPLCGFVLFHTLLFNGKSVVCGNNFPSFDIVNMWWKLVSVLLHLLKTIGAICSINSRTDHCSTNCSSDIILWNCMKRIKMEWRNPTMVRWCTWRQIMSSSSPPAANGSTKSKQVCHFTLVAVSSAKTRFEVANMPKVVALCCGGVLWGLS